MLLCIRFFLWLYGIVPLDGGNAMYKHNEKLDTVFRATLIPITVIGEEGDVLFSSFADEHHEILQNFLAGPLSIYKLKTGNVPFVSSFGTVFLLGVYRTGNETIVLGPSCYQNNAQYHDLQETLDSSYPADRMVAFFNSLTAMPVVSLRRFSNSLGVAINIYTHEYLPIAEIVIDNLLAKRPLVGDKFADDVFKFRDEEQYHISFEQEQVFFRSVEAGDVEGLKKQLQALEIGSGFGQMSSNAIRQARYLFVAMLTNVTRSAIKGGVSQAYAYSLSDIYARNMDGLNEVIAIYELACRMIIDFASRVRDKKGMGDVSEKIRLCMDFIDENLYEKISLQDLADKSGLSTKTISLKFKREVGCAVAEYIHREKLGEAKYLLKYSGYSLADISSILGYSSQSYFIRIFKAFEDKTPLEFKEELRASR